MSPPPPPHPTHTHTTTTTTTTQTQTKWPHLVASMGHCLPAGQGEQVAAPPPLEKVPALLQKGDGRQGGWGVRRFGNQAPGVHREATIESQHAATNAGCAHSAGEHGLNCRGRKEQKESGAPRLPHQGLQEELPAKE
jgi:hypothetical protein